MSRLYHRLAKIEQNRFGKPDGVTMSEHWFSRDNSPEPVVNFVSVFGGGVSVVFRRQDHGSDQDFWSAVESAHMSIHGRSKASGKSFKFRTHYEEKP